MGEASDIRLAGGRSQYEGRVEVYRHREWQTVCDDSWDIKDAEVVCRQLGYGYAKMAIGGAAFGQGSGGQWSRVWSCSGREGSLESCTSGSASCSHTEDASVVCASSGKLAIYIYEQSHHNTFITVQRTVQLCVVLNLMVFVICHFYMCVPCSSEKRCPQDGKHREHSIWRSSGILL